MRQKQFEKAPKSKLMERLTQMNVIPDLVPLDTNPIVEVNVRLPEGNVEPGVFIQPEQVKKMLKKKRKAISIDHLPSFCYH